mmetsp:Transcript_17369/g.31166  ORF Transcript_17369/g.31166 Transcript_17369/m.31166 type:complete len:426 (-) Transcript_17369:589-1866(-)
MPSSHERKPNCGTRTNGEELMTSRDKVMKLTRDLQKATAHTEVLTKQLRDAIEKCDLIRRELKQAKIKMQASSFLRTGLRRRSAFGGMNEPNDLSRVEQAPTPTPTSSSAHDHHSSSSTSNSKVEAKRRLTLLEPTENLPSWMWTHLDDHRAKLFLDHSGANNVGMCTHRDLFTAPNFLGEKGRDFTFVRQQLTNRARTINASLSKGRCCDINDELVSEEMRKHLSTKERPKRRKVGSGSSITDKVWTIEGAISDSRQQLSTFSVLDLAWRSTTGRSRRQVETVQTMDESVRALVIDLSERLGGDDVLSGTTCIVWPLELAVQGFTSAFTLALQQSTMGRAFILCGDSRSPRHTFKKDVEDSIEAFRELSSRELQPKPFVCVECLERRGLNLTLTPTLTLTLSLTLTGSEQRVHSRGTSLSNTGT